MTSALTTREKRLVGILFAVAVLLRIATAIDYTHNHPLADRPVIDEASYERWALEIADGNWVGDEVFFQEPLYPYFLGTLYGVWGLSTPGARSPERMLQIQRTAARHTQSFLGALSVVFVYFVTRRVFGKSAALVAGLALATYGPLLVFPSFFLKPNLLLPLLSGLLLLCLRLSPGAGVPAKRRAWLCVGLLAAAAALLRGNMLLLLPFFVLLPFVFAAGGTRAPDGRAHDDRAAPWRSSAAVLTGAAMLLLPVAYRNHTIGGVLALTTSGAGTNLYGGNNAANFWGVATEFDWVRGIPEYEAADWKHEAERRTGRSLDAGDVSAYWMGEALRSLRASPRLHLRILWNKFWLTLGRYEVPDNHHLAWDRRYLFLTRLPWPGFALWGWLGLAGVLAFVWRGQAPPGEGVRHLFGARLLVGFFLLYLATIVLTVTSMRVRLALVPLLLPFGGYLVARAPRVGNALGRWLQDAPVSPMSAPRFLICLALAALPVFVPAFGVESRAEDLAERDFNHAVYLLEDGEHQRARAIAEELQQVYPGTSRLETLLAEIATEEALVVLRDPCASPVEREEAVRPVRHALARLRTVVQDPDVSARERFRARKLAGRIQLEIDDDPAAAERHFRTALEFDPRDRLCRLGLANALYLQGIGRAADDFAEAKLHVSLAVLNGLIEEAPSDALVDRRAEVQHALDLVLER